MERSIYTNNSPHQETEYSYREVFDIIDGQIYDCTYSEILDRNTAFFNEPNIPLKMAKLDALDSRSRKFKPIDILKLVVYLCSFNEIRQLVYNNKWGVVVRTPKKTSFPERIVMEELHSIIKEALSSPNLKDRQKILLFLDSAPIGSIAAKIWKMFETIHLEPVMGNKCDEFSGAWESIVSRY